MKTRWTAGLEEQLSKDIVQNYKESAVMRRRFKKILEDLIDENRNTQSSKLSYDNPNWPYFQADRMGYERALRDIIGYINE